MVRVRLVTPKAVREDGFLGMMAESLPKHCNLSVSLSSGGPCPAKIRGMCGMGKVVGGDGGRVLSRCGMRRVCMAA